MRTRYDELHAAFETYDEQNPIVWGLFVQFTFDRIRRGYQHYSVNAIFERIRWEADGKLIGAASVADFKLNNNLRPFYARKFHSFFPEHAGFFRLRDQESKHAPPVRRNQLRPADFPYIQIWNRHFRS